MSQGSQRGMKIYRRERKERRDNYWNLKFYFLISVSSAVSAVERLFSGEIKETV